MKIVLTALFDVVYNHYRTDKYQNVLKVPSSHIFFPEASTKVVDKTWRNGPKRCAVSEQAIWK
jgi:hypothetical protein